MSRVGKKPIVIPKGVEIKKDGNIISIKGPKGSLSASVHPDVKVNIDKDKNEIVCNVSSSAKFVRSLHGLWRALLNNMVNGVTNGHEKKLEIQGVGYKAEMLGKKLRILLGYSHPIIFAPPEEIVISTPSPTNVVVSGVDKVLVGDIAAKIRSFREPEPYKGKGIRYVGEKVRRKAGKAAAAGGK